ncbi:AP-5 complex subunit zeta-1-like isoform X2 [Myxocyprinus asiaticus]|uniref:AP-5 complex subunit zeta-1-like isoform X2 n=1 Tax=Myxocyprinus asiaticus TaxID=70543 RepID=UPI0022219816|nr:AP-5 complex subunit zeta-1-like isoform X2 [Myxocyprinus asiaticus]
MYSAATESLIKQAREIKEEELQKFCGRIFKQLHTKELGGEIVDSLQRLHLIVSATKYAREIPSDLVMKLLMVLCSSSCPEQLQILSSSILQESLPLSIHSLSSDLSQDSRAISHLASVVLSQAGNKEDVMPLCHHLLKILESRLSEGQMSKHALPILSKMISVYPEILTEDQVNLVSRKLVDWLRYASMQQGASMSSGGFFSGQRTRQPAPLTEVDGVVTGDFFTVLCVGQSYTEDQWMNMYTFSMIKSWLLTYDRDGTTNAESAPLKRTQVILSQHQEKTQPMMHKGKQREKDDRSELDSSVMSMVSATSSSSRLLPPKERLREKAFEYCQRLIEQSDRKALKRTDTELQKACIVESVSIMDIICGEDPSYVYRAFPCIKALYGRLNGDLAHAQALLPIAQFYLNHSETAAVDSEAVFRKLFSHCPAEQFNEPMLAFEFIQFCLLNASVLQDRVANYRQSFPNLLKFLAWNCPGLITEFVELLPSLVAPGTAIELLHTLLDLPCLAAALDLQHRSACYQALDRTTWDQQGVKLAACLDAFRQPSYRGLFLYILRPEAGTGDTIDRLKMLHEILADMAESPRVVRCAQVVPVLLHVYFNTVAKIADEKLMNQLLLVLLERSSLLYNIKTFNAEVQKVFSTHLQALCKLHPSLIVDQSRELLDFAGSPANIYSKEDIYTHVVWVIGEYLSVSYDSRCTVELITSFFESLEPVLFEITQVRQSTSPPSFSPRLITVLMTTLAKLATRSQDLIPRASLFLSKMRSFARSSPVMACYSEEDSEEIITRAHELINLLKLPNVAQFVLASSAGGDSPRWHRDTNASLPQGMRAVSRLLHRQSSFLAT